MVLYQVYGGVFNPIKKIFERELLWEYEIRELDEMYDFHGNGD